MTIISPSHFRSRFYGNSEQACLHHVLIEVISSSRNLQMSGPLLELHRGHMVVFDEGPSSYVRQTTCR